MAKDQHVVAQVIENVVQSVKSHRNYDAQQLERSLNTVIAATSWAHIKFRIDVAGHTESSRNAKHLNITDVKLEIGAFRIALKVQLPQRAEKWIVHIYLSKSLQKRASALEFHKELKIAAHQACGKEKCISSSPKTDSVRDTPADACVLQSDQPIVTKKRRTRIVSVLTADAIIAILKKWRKEFSIDQKIDQRDFKKLAQSALTSSVNATLIVNYWEKRGFLTVEKPMPRKVFVQLTDSSRWILAEHDREMKKQESIRVSKIFSKDAAPALQRLLSLSTLQTEIGELVREEDAIVAEIAALQNKRQKIEQKRIAHQKMIGRELTTIDQEELNMLLRSAEMLQ